LQEAEAKKLFADIQRASQHLSKDQRTDALLIYHEVSQRAGRHAPIQFATGQLCEQIGDVDQAITHYVIAAEERPDMPQYLSTLGIAYLNSGEPQKALETLESALALNPDLPDVLHGLGVYYMRRADHEQSVGYLEKACEQSPSDASMRANLAISLTRLNRHDDALTHSRKAVSQNGTDPDANLALCTTLTELGQMDEAVRHLEKTIRQHRDFGHAYDLLARIKKFSPADSAFMQSAEKVLKRGMPAKARYSLHFALGKMNDDCGQYDAAFGHYQQANLLRKADYSLKRDSGLLKEMKKAFTTSTIKSFARHGHQSSQPVFIVGMPRSGTTLMERIIASHPQGGGAGELPEIPTIAKEIFPAKGRGSVSARARDGLTPEKIQTYAERYLDVLGQGRPDAQRVVDKMPSNFYFVGLIKSMFPNATIIHAIRHPLDICLSCYFQSFSDLPWANDFRSIATIYSLYREAMTYWKKVLPEGQILDVHYEQLVEDTEGQSKRMLDACGLEWDETVLEFFLKKGVVKTASVAQTRQPIYKSSKARWMKYAAHIDELSADLSEYLQGDAAQLAEHGIDLPAPSALSKFKRLLN